MNIQQLFPHLGKVIAGAGSRHFTRLLHDLINASLPVDATHVTQYRASSGIPVAGPVPRNCIGSTSPNSAPPPEPIVLSPEQLKAAQLYEHAGDTYRVIAGQVGNEPVKAAANCQMHLASYQQKNGQRCVISVFRTASEEAFTPQERAKLKDLALMLLPIIEEHIASTTPSASNVTALHGRSHRVDNKVPALSGLRERFQERLCACELNLSERETEVCIGLLAGHTVPELAERLALKVSTVESYFKRAAVKMSINGRRALLRWLHASEPTENLQLLRKGA